jgi:hypothetical protein
MTPVPKRMSQLVGKIAQAGRMLTVSGLELERVKHLDGGNQESKSLARTSLCSTQNILASKKRRDTSCLDLGHLLKLHVVEGLECFVRKVDVSELFGQSILSRERDSQRRGQI